MIKNVISQLVTHKEKKYKKRSLFSIKSIAVHHSMTTSGTPQAFARYHVEHNDWPGIGYHYVIAKSGLVYKCNDVRVISYHVGNSNKEAIGICLVGDFRFGQPTDKQINSLKALVINLGSNITSIKEVKGHNEYPGYSWKECPAFDLSYIKEEFNKTREKEKNNEKSNEKK